ncbi:ion channel [Rhizobium sp. Kim5]|uniref:ion channel n=1 Tax=Rhizobium sp. Kim5 TaxID=2020311 RepID=UPI0001903C00|nr:ion channel [Rhizobium sp. Kim5]
MPFIASLLRRVYLSLSELAWSALLVILVAHLVASYLLFLLAGEGDLVGNPVDFLYYYMVTATTVGYGDLSPKSRHNVTLVGMLSHGVTDLNCRDETLMQGGETLYYISGIRLDPAAIAWARMGDVT